MKAGMPIVTTMRADLPPSSGLGKFRVSSVTANPWRKVCSKKALSRAGCMPCQSGWTMTRWSHQAMSFWASIAAAIDGGAANSAADRSGGRFSAPMSMRRTSCPAAAAPAA